TGEPAHPEDDAPALGCERAWRQEVAAPKSADRISGDLLAINRGNIWLCRAKYMPQSCGLRNRRSGSRVNNRIAAVPFTLRNLKEDLDDVGSNFGGAPDLEFRLATKALELEQSGLSYQRIPPDYRFPYGHTHEEQEEVYVVVRGSGRMKLDDEIVEVKEWDVVRVPPGTWRGYEGGTEGLEILVFGAPNLGDDPREDVEGERDWWAD
ncbi:MAG: hypothetical protein QOJ29_419, partial [Thermoleophilaceae bacterium]|nr:hypothetical protein [Thermoleophilaceae bacterium]